MSNIFEGQINGYKGKEITRKAFIEKLFDKQDETLINTLIWKD